MALPELYHSLSPEEVAALFDADPDPVFVLSRAARIIALNWAARSLLEYHVLGRTATGRLVFGNAALNANVGRAMAALDRHNSTARILKRHDGDSWLGLDFLALPHGEDVLIRLKVECQRELRRDDIGPAARALNLTEREAEVAFLMCHALSTKEIARELAISPNTAKMHLRAVYAKSGCRGYADSLRTLLNLVR